MSRRGGRFFFLEARRGGTVVFFSSRFLGFSFCFPSVLRALRQNRDIY